MAPTEPSKSPKTCSAAVQQPERDYVRHQPGDGDGHHGPAGYGLGGEKAMRGFPDDHHRDKQQRQRIEKRRQRGQTQIIEGVADIGSAGGKTYRQ